MEAREQLPGQAGGASDFGTDFYNGTPDISWSLVGFTSWGLVILLTDLLEEQSLNVSKSLIPLLHLNEHRRLHIRQANGDGQWLGRDRETSWQV